MILNLIYVRTKKCTKKGDFRFSLSYTESAYIYIYDASVYMANICFVGEEEEENSFLSIFLLYLFTCILLTLVLQVKKERKEKGKK